MNRLSRRLSHSLYPLICLVMNLSLVPQSSPAQHRFDYAAIRRGDFTPKTVSGVRSMNDGEHYTIQDEGRIIRCSYRTGEQEEVLFDRSKMEPCVDFSDYHFSADERRILLTSDVKPIYRRSFSAEYWIYDLEQQQLWPLSAAGAQQQATFSPDGNRVAFVRDNNLFIVDLASATEQQITPDGKHNQVINGLPDWVYEEEFALVKAFAWSPDSKHIAWLRFDESAVREYNMNRFNDSLYPENYTFKYPKAGEENARVELFELNLSTGTKTRIDTGNETDQYLPGIFWTPSGELALFRLNRSQNRFEILLSDPNGLNRVIYDEQNDRYIERFDLTDVIFLRDGDRFIVRSERNGFTHLYLYSIRKGFLHPITSGAWEVTALLGVEGDQVYYLSTETSPLKRDLYTIQLNGKGKQQLTDGNGTYRILPSLHFRYFIRYFSNVSTPDQITLHRAEGTWIRTLEENALLKTKLSEFKVPVKTFFTFQLSDGTTLNGYMLRPSDFDSTKRYPLLMTQYSGPGSQQVADRWSVGWEDALVQEEYLVACVDGRGTGFRGEDFKKCTYKQLGRLEVEDQIAAARYLGSLSYIDSTRIGIYGWSYGGFMALNLILKGNAVFRMAIAIAPVTSWRYYDTIYTERYNGTPQENPAGYDNYSPIHFADSLQGALLIAHGTADDNVHIQNSYEMIERFVERGKQFEMQLYPDQNHNMGSARHHLMERCIDFVRKKL